MVSVGRGSDQFVLRLPDGMRSQIKEIAARNRRSMNAEIVTILELAVLKDTATKKADATA